MILVVGLWFGIKALREAPVAGGPETGGAAAGAPGGPPPAAVIVAVVEKREAEERRRVTGSLRAVDRAEVAARESGAVEKVSVIEGGVVKKGDILASLDARRLDAELAQAKAKATAMKALVTQREAEAKRAVEDLKMKKELVADRAVSQREYLDAEREAAVAEARTQAARDEWAAEESARRLLEVRRSDLEIKAPFDGRVVKNQVDLGEWLTEGSPVVTLVTVGTIEAWLDVPERFAASIDAAGKDLAVIADGNGHREMAKSIRRVADVDNRTRLFSVVVTLDDGDGALVPGMSVHADLPVSEPVERLAVPVDAIVVTRDATFVYRASAPAGEGALPVAEKLPVTEVFRRDGIAYLQSDALEVGDEVIVEGNERLFPGTPLMVTRPDAGPPVAE